MGNVCDARVALVPDIGVINARCKNMNVECELDLVLAHEVVVAILLRKRGGTAAYLQTPTPDRHRFDHVAMYCPLWQAAPKFAIHLIDRFKARRGSIVTCIRRAVALASHWFILGNVEHRAWSKNGFKKPDEMAIRCNKFSGWHQFVVANRKVNRLLNSNCIFHLKD